MGSGHSNGSRVEVPMSTGSSSTSSRLVPSTDSLESTSSSSNKRESPEPDQQRPASRARSYAEGKISFCFNIDFQIATTVKLGLNLEKNFRESLKECAYFHRFLQDNNKRAALQKTSELHIRTIKQHFYLDNASV